MKEQLSSEVTLQLSPVDPADWLSADTLARMTPALLIERAAGLKPLLAEHALEAEKLRRPLDAVWRAIRRSGVFYHFVPKCYGGLEYDLTTFIDAMLPLGEGCASTGWVTAFCVEHNWMMAQFPKEAQDEIFGAQPYIIAPGATNPPGTVTVEAAGYRVTGRWKWGTGVMHADWVLVTGLGPNSREGNPEVLFFAIPAAEISVIDTWYVDGMIGTGSNDIAANDVFVPKHRCLNFSHMREGKAPGALLHDNPIYRVPMLPFLAMTAALAGIGTTREAVQSYRRQVDVRLTFGSTSKQAERPAAQMRLARADLNARTAELLIRAVAGEMIDIVVRRGRATVEERIRLRAQIAHAMELCRAAIRQVCEAGGARSHFLDNPLQRALRDINVMSSHVAYDLDTATELHGRAMLGLPPNSALT